MACSKTVTILVMCLAVPAAWALPAPGVLDDAGSGQDAGASPGSALSIGYGAYWGNLTLDDADWFAFPSAGVPSCLEASVATSHAMRVGIETGTGGSVLGGLTDGLFATTLAVEPSSLALGILSEEEPWDAFSVGPYGFSLVVAPPSVVGDARQRDASPFLAQAEAAPAACFSGVFHGNQQDGDLDIWSFSANAGDAVTYSLAAETDGVALLAVLASNGSVVGSPVASGGVGEVPLDSAGTYYLSAFGIAPSAQEQYALAFRVGPEPSGCRPYCLT